MEQEQIYNISQRTAIGKFSGIVGILCNLALSGLKIVVGILWSSMSILADGWNNLSDAASSVVTLIGFRLAEKPADHEHPYGHARFEYLASLVVAAMILAVGFEVGKSSVEKMVHPMSISFSIPMVFVLVCAIGVKAWMMFFNRKMGEKIQSNTLLATAQDSRNDVITTSVVLFASVLEYFTGWKVDGFMGFLVAVFILYSGIKLAKETISPLLGEGANPKLRAELEDYIKSCPKVLGCHDLMVHDYGPGKCFASMHVEMDKDEDTMLSHELIDKMERVCLSKYGVHMVIHYDPVITGNPEIDHLRELVLSILKVRDSRMSVHDFRIINCEGSKKLNFDVAIPAELYSEEEDIRQSLEAALNHIGQENYHVDITFDPS